MLLSFMSNSRARRALLKQINNSAQSSTVVVFEKATVQFWSATACRRFVKAEGWSVALLQSDGRPQKLDRSLRLTRDQFDQPSFSLRAKVIIFLNKFKKIGRSSVAQSSL